MSYSGPNPGSEPGPSGIGSPVDDRPHAYDPYSHPELFDGVLARRVVAFVIDLIIIALPLIAASLFIFVVGLITFGLGWALFWLLSPASVGVGLVILWHYARRPGIGDAWHAQHGNRNAHLVRGAVLFRTRRRPRHCLLGQRQRRHAADPGWSDLQSAATGCCMT